MEAEKATAFRQAKEESESLNPPTQTALTKQICDDGYACVPGVLDADTVVRFRTLVDAARAREQDANVANGSGTYGLRNLTDVVPETAELVRHPRVAQIVHSAIGPGAFMVRATLFDKTPGANWGVFWHQDLSIAVKGRYDVQGFSAWTVKAGVQCVQPPVALMENVVAVRLHLDDCFASNGALKVLSGTHRLKRLSAGETEFQKERATEIVCEVSSGGAVVMKPLLLHASSPMDVETCRRVVHFEFAAFELPEPLGWKYRIGTGC